MTNLRSYGDGNVTIIEAACNGPTAARRILKAAADNVRDEREAASALDMSNDSAEI